MSGRRIGGNRAWRAQEGLDRVRVRVRIQASRGVAVVPMPLGSVLLPVPWLPRFRATRAGLPAFGPDAKAVSPDFLTRYGQCQMVPVAGRGRVPWGPSDPPRGSIDVGPPRRLAVAAGGSRRPA